MSFERAIPDDSEPARALVNSFITLTERRRKNIFAAVFAASECYASSTTCIPPDICFWPQVHDSVLIFGCLCIGLVRWKALSFFHLVYMLSVGTSTSGSNEYSNASFVSDLFAAGVIGVNHGLPLRDSGCSSVFLPSSVRPLFLVWLLLLRAHYPLFPFLFSLGSASLNPSAGGALP